MQRKKNFIDLFWMSFVLTQKVRWWKLRVFSSYSSIEKAGELSDYLLLVQCLPMPSLW